MVLNFLKRGAFLVKGLLFNRFTAIFVVAFALTMAGSVVGYSLRGDCQECVLRAVSHAELKGCEITGQTVHNMLMRCEWNLEKCVETVEMYRESLFGR
jgi:hypothetical protein